MQHRPGLLDDSLADIPSTSHPSAAPQLQILTDQGSIVLLFTATEDCLFSAKRTPATH